jgi:hypothetical protein
MVHYCSIWGRKGESTGLSVYAAYSAVCFYIKQLTYVVKVLALYLTQ